MNPNPLVQQTSLIQLSNRQPHYLLVEYGIELAPDYSCQTGDAVRPVTMLPHYSGGQVQAVRLVADQVIDQHLVCEGMDEQPFLSRSK